MFNRPEITAEWTVHAQVTISHPGQETRTGSENPSEDGNVRVVYSWHGHSGDDSGGAAATVLNPTTDRYGFNRGGMTFSVVPPCKSNQMSDSGYTSEKPASLHSQEKKCRSTCNITLTTPHAMQMVPSIPNRRAFSLRCPSSTISENVTADTIPKRANTFTTHFCTELPERRVEIRDAASQTTPIPTEADTEDERDRAESVRRKNRVYARRRHETDSVILGSRNSRSTPRRLCRSPASKLLSSPEISNLTVQTPIKLNGKSTNLPQTESQISKTSEGNSSSDSRKPRTVHIDVYCTGSEIDDEENIEENSEKSSNSENDDSASTPQTVFESEKVRVSHTKISNPKELPRAWMMHKGGIKPSSSSGYPSMASSSSTIAKGLSASTMSSLMNSGSRLGFSSHATSWKDTTTSDMESLLNSAPNSRPISMAPSIDSFDYEDSLDKERIQALDRLLWIQSKTWKSPDVERKLRSKLQHIDSDESNEEEDEETSSWIFSKTDEDSPCSIVSRETDLYRPTLTQMSSQISSMDADERNCIPGEHISYYNIHEDKFDVINANLRPSSDTISKLLQSPGVATKVQNPEIECGLTSSNINIPQVQQGKYIPKKDNDLQHTQQSTIKPAVNKGFVHRLTIGNTGAVKVEESENSIPEKESSRSTSPFINTLPGYFTGHLERARRFGNVMGTLKKPGHHVGPAKNPNCSCEHCKRWMSMGGATRGRAFSAGAVQIHRPYIRRDSKRNTSEEPESVSLGWTDL